MQLEQTAYDANGPRWRELMRTLRANGQVLAMEALAITIHGAPSRDGRRFRVHEWVHAG